MPKLQKLGLTWIGKENRPRLEPRILLEDSSLSYHAAHRVTDKDIFDNQLIFGDNLLALKALEQEFAGKIKCIFIDPPYNTGSAFKQYDDTRQHSDWLSLIRDRLYILRNLLRQDGSIWITIDDTEAHYLKVLGDEIFGRDNFVANVVWQKKSSPQPNAVWLSDSHDHILVFAKDKSIWRPNKLERTEAQNAIYKHSDEFDGIDESGKPFGRGPWFPGDATASLRGGQRGAQFARTGHSPNIYEIVAPSGRTILPPPGTCWRFSKVRFEEMVADHRITFGANGNNRPCVKRFLSEISEGGVVPMTVWHYREVGENRVAAAEVREFNRSDPFTTPKPEKLLQRILTIGSQPGDLVLDSFAGSGTSGAVAQKMGRRWIMIELGEHIHTHITPRLKKVIDGTDQGGISKAMNWKGGGGFRYYRLAPSLLEKDKWANWVINKEYNAAMLAEALCKIEGFTYAPSDSVYWQHGKSTECDFIYVTTAHLTHDQLQQLSDEVGPERSLLVLCTAFRAKADQFSNLTIKKIPKAVLARCEWGHDDYSLQVENLPASPPEPGQGDLFAEEAAG
jgi:adenine-specific DNA-methyltransferase